MSEKIFKVGRNCNDLMDKFIKPIKDMINNLAVNIAPEDIDFNTLLY